MSPIPGWPSALFQDWSPWTSEMLDDYWADDLLSVWWTRWDFSDGSASLEDLCCLVRECWDWELHWRLALAIGPSSFILPSASSPSQLPPSLPHIRTETRTLTSRSLLAARRACSTDLPRECWFLIFFCQQIFIRPSLLKVWMKSSSNVQFGSAESLCSNYRHWRIQLSNTNQTTLV